MYSYVCFDSYLQEPIEVKSGEPYYVTKLVGKRRRKVLTQDSIVYIPIAKTLKSLLQIPDIRAAINQPHTTQVAKFNDMCDGSVFKEHPVFSHSAHAIEIIAYYDEIELCNPLGSHTKVHKLVCLLFTIVNIHPKYRKTMFLVSLAKVCNQ